MAHRDLDVSLSKFRQLLNRVNTLEGKLNDKDMNILDGIENPPYAKLEFPPKSAALKLADVRLVYNNKLNMLNVMEPQDYNCVTKLTKAHYMMQPLPRSASCGKYKCGLFHTGKSGIAQSGDGGDGGDKWYLANNAMYRYLSKKLAFMQKVIQLDKK